MQCRYTGDNCLTAVRDREQTCDAILRVPHRFRSPNACAGATQRKAVPRGMSSRSFSRVAAPSPKLEFHSPSLTQQVQEMPRCPSVVG
jgi:hypothetical protein